MNRRRFLTHVGLGAGAACLGGAGAASAADKTAPGKPNVVIFVSDDMGWSDVGYHGSIVKTPTIDKLVADGVELDRFYVFPICSPTRVALMTGRSPIRCGITRPLGPHTNGPPLDERFMSEAFRAAGYRTVITGKWHLGGAKGYTPRERGFDHFYGFLTGFIDYYKHTDAQSGQVDWQRNGETVNEEGYSTDLIAQEAVRMIRGRDRSKPLLLYVPFNAPYGPAQAPEALIAKYTGGGLRGQRAVRAAMIDSMDQAMGKVLAALDAEGMTSSTLAMFFCDNGASDAARKRPPRGDATAARGPRQGEVAMGNAPFSGGKSSAREGGIRVPAVIRWPGVLQAGTKTRQVLSVLDLLPTLAAAAGIEPGNTKPLDGENVWPALRDGKVVPRKGVVIGLSDLAVLDGPWKLHQTGGEYTLYDLEKDPTEKQDLAAKHPDVVEMLKAIQAPYAKLIAAQPGGKGRPGGPKGGKRPGRRPGPKGPR